MMKMRKFAAALVLGLIMCLALFTTGAFAQSAFRGHGASATAIAVAGGNNGGCGFGWGCGGFGGWPFGGCWNSCFFPGFFDGGSAAFAFANAGSWW